MTKEEMIEQLENTIMLIKQNGKDWLDERDIPILEACIQRMKTEPCEDCISRQAVIKAIRKSPEFETVEDGFWTEKMKDTCYKSSLLEDIKELPPVQPKPKTGHWVLVQRGKCVDMNCSECGSTRIKEYAYNITVDQIDKENLKEITEDLKFCEKCGAKMESEE